jgi:glucan biosynthesis protein C
MMFAAGILTHRGNWLEALLKAGQSWCKWIALACLMALPAGFILGGGASGDVQVFTTGFSWQMIFITSWAGLACVSISLTLMGFFCNRFNKPGRLQRILCQNAYAVYVLHPVVLVSITLAMTGLPLPVLIKFSLAALLAIGLTYLLAILVRWLPGMKHVL